MYVEADMCNTAPCNIRERDTMTADCIEIFSGQSRELCQYPVG